MVLILSDVPRQQLGATTSSRDATQLPASASRGASQPANEASYLWLHIFDLRTFDSQLLALFWSM